MLNLKSLETIVTWYVKMRNESQGILSFFVEDFFANYFSLNSFVELRKSHNFTAP